MANMSYCRWRNTYADVFDCFDSFENEEEMSCAEIKSAKKMIERMCEFLYENGVINDYDTGGIFAEFDNRNDGLS